ncbi:MAG: NAD(P)/FAD-dependent oxidoreductase, partial [Candidatus Bathyarchaeia archaeon]
MKGIVVGGGISGTSIAYNLAKKGVDVTLIERQWPGVGSTGRGAGGIRSQWTSKADIMLAKRSVALLKNLQGELDFNILFRQGGYLITAFDEENAKILTKAAALQQVRLPELYRQRA